MNVFFLIYLFFAILFSLLQLWMVSLFEEICTHAQTTKDKDIVDNLLKMRLKKFWISNAEWNVLYKIDPKRTKKIRFIRPILFFMALSFIITIIILFIYS